MKKKNRTNGEEWAYGAVKRDRQTDKRKGTGTERRDTGGSEQEEGEG